MSSVITIEFGNNAAQKIKCGIKISFYLFNRLQLVSQPSTRIGLGKQRDNIMPTRSNCRLKKAIERRMRVNNNIIVVFGLFTIEHKIHQTKLVGLTHQLLAQVVELPI